MLRGINKYDKYDSFINESILSKNRTPNNDDILEYEDPYKQLTKIFSQKNWKFRLNWL